MSIKSLFGLNRDLVKKGRWFDIGDHSFLLAYTGTTNDRWVKTQERIYKPFRYQIDKEILPEATGKQLYLDVFLECILLDWKNVREDEKSDALDFTRENAQRMMTDYPELYYTLRQLSSEFKHFKVDDGKGGDANGDAEVDAKN